MEPEAEETADDLAGRILGRLANQEGRVLVKLPTTMDLDAYQGFKTALDFGTLQQPDQCIRCHRLPHFGNAEADPVVPTLRNRKYTLEQFRDRLKDPVHRELQLSAQDVQRLHALSESMIDVSDAQFRELIVGAEVVDTLGDQP